MKRLSVTLAALLFSSIVHCQKINQPIDKISNPRDQQQLSIRDAELTKLQDEVIIANANAAEARLLVDGYKEAAADAAKAAQASDGMMKWVFGAVAILFG